MNTQSDDQINNAGGTSDVSAKEQLDTHGSGEPSADNVDVQAGHGKGSDSAKAGNPENADNSKSSTSDVSAKEQLDTHSSGEPSSDNVDVRA